ncbi:MULTISPECIES: response regulator transcription factor [Corynebacterium]|uniref:response regulator n=1 Tax=Corynebacterium TaxID=1716 RepID=UPI00254D35ED|nr:MULTISPECIES: response regulator transcription factor [Corynebacterium]MDK8894936.1 response regulator transcription factor [Corynebacterium sp. MSK006]
MTERPGIRVLLVDDQELVRTGLRLVLNTTPDIRVVGEAGNGREALEKLKDGLAVDVVCMDVRMPEMDGIASTEAIVAAGLPAKVLVLTTFDLDEYVYDALAVGASGFLLKDCGSAELMAGIRTIAAGESVLAPTATTRLIRRFRPQLQEQELSPRREDVLELLSPRELEVLKAVGRGMKNQEIASTLYMAETTVKTHVGHLLMKLDARDRVQLVILAHEIGVVGE